MSDKTDNDSFVLKLWESYKKRGVAGYCKDNRHNIAKENCIRSEHPVSIIYTNKTGDCLSFFLSFCLSVCSAMDGQTARPNGLKFGG